MSRKRVVTLDVRPDLNAGREPFSKIMTTVSALEPDQDLLLIAPFEPAPLYSVLANQGFRHKSTQTASGDWEVLFSRDQQASPAKAKGGARAAKSPEPPTGASAAGAVIDVDARGLEPPQPLVKILEALSTIPAGGQLRAHTERRPMHLYAHLEERGFAWETAEQNDGSFITHVRPR